jgi:ribosomal protein L37AE/L43A
MESEKHPVVVCTNCYRFARLNLSLMIYYCPMCNKSVTAEEVYDELGEGVRNDG